MPSLFSRIRGKDGQGKLKSKKHQNAEDLTHQLPSKPRWEDAYTRTWVEPEEVHELIRKCTEELKARALDHPFLMLPFRPTSDPSAVRTFIRHFFEGGQHMRGEAITQELRMIEPMVISGVLKWCWSRLPGGIVGWDAYELFKVGEHDSSMARDAFSTFIPLSVDNELRARIIFDYFDLLSAIAAHGKMNGFGGRKLSRMAAWWAFEHKDTGNGFDGGYKAWLNAADATSHMFFAYLRSLSPQSIVGGISMLPMSLQKLLQETEYPPQLPSLLQSSTNRVVMIVDNVSFTPFALLRRANHFQYRDDDRALQEFSEYEDPVKALTEECRRVLKAISLANQSQVSSSKHSTSLRDASWSRFEDIGFAGGVEEEEEEDDYSRQLKETRMNGLRTTPASVGGGNGARPTTPSWADFLSSGFVDDQTANNTNMLLPPDKILPPIETGVRQRSSQSHRPRLEGEGHLEPGELASITTFDLDDSFWWVWMSSLAPEETAERKSAFGRCAVVETIIRSGRWLVMEEMVKGAAPEPDAGAYIAEKKGFFSWTRRNKGISRSKSTKHGPAGKNDKTNSAVSASASKSNIGVDQQARIHAAAQKLHAKQAQEQQMGGVVGVERRGRSDADLMKEKTNSVFTLQPVIVNEASPAMKWATKYDKETVRGAYLSNTNAGRGSQTNGHSESKTQLANGHDSAIGSVSSPPPPPEKPQPAEEERKENIPPQHPLEVPEKTDSATGRDAPLPTRPRNDSWPVPNREDMVISPEPHSPEGKKQHKKLHKEEKKPGGLKKLFSRSKNRNSKLPDNAAGSVNAMLAKDQAAEPTPAAPTPVPEINEPEPEQAEEPQPSTMSSHTEAAPPAETEFATPMDEDGSRTPTQNPDALVGPEPTYEPSVEESLERMDTNEEAKREFSRFDQGPLSEQPAFIPDDDEGTDDEAAPPPIARHPSNNRLKEAAQAQAGEEAPAPTTVPSQDRWATIRKNATERAQRQSEEQSHGAQSKTTDNDDDTSGEETIESRVARIKARVAELTGNMETEQNGGAVPPRR